MQNSGHIALANTVCFTLNNASDAIMQVRGAYPLVYIMVATVIMIAYLLNSFLSSETVYVGKCFDSLHDSFSLRWCAGRALVPFISSFGTLQM